MDGRKMLADERCGLMADVERDEVLRLFGGFGGNGAGQRCRAVRVRRGGRNAA